MLKNKLKTALIITLLIIFALAPFAHAVNESDARTIEEGTSLEDDAITIEEASELPEDQSEESIDQNAKNSDVYLVDEDIIVDYTVIGNAYIIGNNVTISAPIGGDAFIIANNITIEETGYVYSNLFSCSNKLTIKGIVYDAYSVASNITISESGYIYRDIRSTTSNIDILGTIGRNAYIACEKMSLDYNNKTTDYTSEKSENATGIIYGNLEYSSQNQFTFPEDSIEGEVKYTQISMQNDNKSFDILDTVVSIISTIVFTVVIFLMLNWLAPKYLEKSKELLATKILPVVGFGLLGLFVIPIMCIILLILNITVGLSFLLLGIYIMLIAISTAIFTITASNFIADKLNVNNKWLKILIVAVGAAIVYSIKLIPYLGGLVGFIVILLGLGLLVKGILPNKEN